MANQQINVNIAGNSASLVSSVNKATTSLKSLGSVIATVSKGLGALSVGSGKVTSQLTKLGAVLPIKAIGSLGKGFQSLTNWVSNHNRVLAQSATYYKGLVGQVSNLNRFINVLGSSVRQIGQGLQNFGTSFTLYVSAPVSAFIYSMTKGFIEFQDRMIEVRRTTGLAMSDVEILSDRIQQISLTTPTVVEDLASVAADWGRLGITNIDTISRLTEEADKLMLATSLTKDQVVNDLGKIGSLYFETEGELAENYSRVASAINELGQASPVSEQDIVGAFLRAAPVGQLLNISLPDMLGLATTVAERAASPERAGSQLSRALTEQASKVQIFADALGQSREEVIKLIDTDAVGFFMNMLDVISRIDSKTKQVQIAEALFGGVGGKATNALAANLEGLYANITLANDAYDDGTSIQKEYLRATDSVKVQLGILQNNFRFLGYTIAEQVIPYVSKFAAIMIPALRSATEAFGGLSEKTKLMVVGFGLLMAVLGPLTIFLGSLLFSVGIITTGLTALFTQVIGIGVGLGQFAFSILALLQPIGLLVTAIIAIGAAFVYITGAASQAGNMLAAYITQFVTWGYNLMGGFAQGIADGAKLVYDVVLAVINGFIGLIQAFSPPKEGPLRGIRDWGKNLMGTYAEGIDEAAPEVRNGFLKATGLIQKETALMQKNLGADSTDAGSAVSGGIADGVEVNMPAVKRVLDALKKKVDETNDYIIHIGAKFSESFANSLGGFSATGMDMFTNIFGEVRSIIESVANNLGLDGDDTDKRILRAANAVRDLISAFESGGNVGSLQSIYDLMGGLGDEAEALVKSQIEYNDATKELDRIKKQHSEIDDVLRKEIESIAGRADLTMNEKSALIRNARFRSGVRKDELKDEQDKAEERVDTLKEETKRREQILNALTGLIFPAEKEHIEKKKEDNITGTLTDFNPDAFKEGLQAASDSTKKLFEDTGEQLGTFFTKIDKAQKMWEGFVTGITGGVKPGFLSAGEDFWSGWTPGNNIRLAWERLQKGIGGVSNSLLMAQTKVKQLLAIFQGGMLMGYLGLDNQFLLKWGIFENIISTIGWGIGTAVAEVETLLTLLKSPALKMWDEFQRTYDTVNAQAQQGSGGLITTFLKELDFAKLGEGLAEGFNIIFQRYLDPESEVFSNLATILAGTFGGLIEFAASFLATADLSLLTTGLANIVNTITNALGPENLDPAVIGDAVKNIIQSLFDGFATLTLIDDAGNNVFAGILSNIIRGISEVETGPFIDSFKSIVISIVEGIGGVSWDDLGVQLAKIINQLLTALGDSRLWIGLGDAFGGLVGGVLTTITNLDWGLTPAVFNGLTAGITSALIATMESEGAQMGADFWSSMMAWIQNAFYQIVTLGQTNNSIKYDADSGVTDVYNNDTGERQRGWLETGSEWIDWFMQNGRGGHDGIMTIDEWNQGSGINTGTGVGTGTPVLAPGTDGLNLLGSSADPETINQAGTQAATTYATAVETGLKSPETVRILSDAITSLTTDTNAAAATDIEAAGTTVGGIMMTGLSDRLVGETAIQELDESWLGGLTAWVKSRETDIEGVGNDVGNKAIRGFLAETNDAPGYMSQWSTTMKKWVDTPSNARKFTNSGITLGVQILKGMADVISGAGPTLAAISESAMAGIPMDKATRDNAIEGIGKSLIPPEPLAEDSMITLSSLPTYSESSSSNVVKFEISIVGGTPQDQNQMKKMVDMLYDKMRKESKLKGVV